MVFASNVVIVRGEADLIVQHQGEGCPGGSGSESRWRVEPAGASPDCLVDLRWHFGERLVNRSTDRLPKRRVSSILPGSEVSIFMLTTMTDNPFDAKAVQAAPATPCGSRRIAMCRLDAVAALVGRRAR